MPLLRIFGSLHWYSKIDQTEWRIFDHRWTVKSYCGRNSVEGTERFSTLFSRKRRQYLYSKTIQTNIFSPQIFHSSNPSNIRYSGGANIQRQTVSLLRLPYLITIVLHCLDHLLDFSFMHFTSLF